MDAEITPNGPAFLSGGGEMGALMRAHDWSSSPLGDPASWPQPLRTIMGVLLVANQPTFVAWGLERTLLYNDAYAEILGDKHPAALGRPFLEVWSELRDDLLPIVERAYAGEPVHMDDITLVMHRRGYSEEAHFAFSYTPVRDEVGAVAGFFCPCTETTAQVLAERRQAFRLAFEEKLRVLPDPDAIMTEAVTRLGEHLGVDRVGYSEIVGDAIVRAAGSYAANGIAPLNEDFPIESFGEAMVARQRQGITEVSDDVLADPERADDVWSAIDTRSVVSVPLVRDRRFRASLYVNNRAPRRWSREDVALIEEVAARTWDAVERARAEAALRQANETLEARVADRTAELTQAVDALHAEARERAKAEDALRQSQKMEGVGQLTGGIAHDFNNMLQVISGGLEMAQRRVEGGLTAEASRYVRLAQQSVTRAAALTHRLLAFARRQTLQPKLVELDELVRGMAGLIRQTVGPAITVDLHVGDGAWSVLCNPNQLENALLNLAINARDAMPDGGRLTFSTTDVALSATDVAGQDGAKAGDYVEIAVCDTGVGMDEAIRARAFEPFFTTKPIGQGTGLGLSQLYGFVRQSDGVVRLDSAPGQGTTVRLYLPRHAPAQLRAEPAAPGSQQEGAGIGEVVLLVEDEREVRALAAERLRELGYGVVEAMDGPAALRLLRDGARVDLLVTDVGLPGGLNGRQVADAVRERRPGLPVLFITGYAGSVLEGQLTPGMAVIGKPFTLDALAAQVRFMLDAMPAT